MLRVTLGAREDSGGLVRGTSFGGTSRLRKAIGLHPSLLRACNVLTPLLIAGSLPIHFPQIPLQTLALLSIPIFHSCIISIPVSHSGTRHPHSTLRPNQNPVIPLAVSEAEGTGGPTDFVGPERRDTATNQPLHHSIRQAPFFRSSLPPIHFSYPSHSFFLLWKFLFPFDASFLLALPLHC